MNPEKAIVLLSGGQDSTTTLFWAKARFEATALSIYYGQRHASELGAAREIAKLAGVPHIEVDFPALGALGGSALVDKTLELKGDGGIPDVAMPQGLPTSFAPGRNLLFLGLAGAAAVKVGAKVIVTGVCQTDYSGYPDCRREFIDAMEAALSLAMPTSAGPLQVLTPLMFLTKEQTVNMAREMPGCWEALGRSVTCYHGQRPGCGTCPACALRAKGFSEAGEWDPSRGEA